MAFVALTEDGTAIEWGYPKYGGNADGKLKEKKVIFFILKIICI